MHTGAGQTLDSWVSWSVCGQNGTTDNVVWLFTGLYTWPFVQGRKQKAPKVPHLDYVAPKHHWKTPAGDSLPTKQDSVPGRFCNSLVFVWCYLAFFLTSRMMEKGMCRFSLKMIPSWEELEAAWQRGSGFQMTSTNWASGVKRTICD